MIVATKSTLLSIAEIPLSLAFLAAPTSVMLSFCEKFWKEKFILEKQQNKTQRKRREDND
jgi:hypothetical protein